MLGMRDSWPALAWANDQTERLHRLVIGTAGDGNFYFTHPRRNLPILVPSRSEKTAGVRAYPCDPRPSRRIHDAPGPGAEAGADDHSVNR